LSSLFVKAFIENLEKSDVDQDFETIMNKVGAQFNPRPILMSSLRKSLQLKRG
jgi:hypothetical protein